MKLNIIEKIIGTAFFTGHIKYASGTFGSLAAILIYLLPGFENPALLLAAISVFTVLGFRLGTKFETVFGKDPSQFVLDEVVGTWISLLFVPKTILFVSISFVIWRILDIVKPFPARSIERLQGGKGIMLDDIVSAIYSLVLVHIVIYFVK